MKLKQIVSAALVLCLTVTQTNCGTFLNKQPRSALQSELQSHSSGLRYDQNGRTILNSRPLVLPWNGQGIRATETHDQITLNPSGKTTFRAGISFFDFSDAAVVGVEAHKTVVVVDDPTPGETPAPPGPAESPAPSASPTPDDSDTISVPVRLEDEPPNGGNNPGPLSGTAGAIFGSIVLSIVAVGEWLFSSKGREKKFDATEILAAKDELNLELNGSLDDSGARSPAIFADLDTLMLNFGTEHNDKVTHIERAGFGLSQVPPESFSAATKLVTNQDSPYFAALRDGELLLNLVSEEKSETAKPLLDAARQALFQADAYFNDGQFVLGKSRLESFESRIIGSMLDTQIPVESGGAESDERVVRRQSWQTGLELAQTGLELDQTGEADLASETHKTADLLLSVALGIVRTSAFADVSLSAMEAFAGKTVDFESGKPVIRDVTNLERAAAILSLGVTAGGTLVAGPAGAAMGAIIGKVGKQVAKSAGKKVGIEAGEAIARDAIHLAEHLKKEAESLGDFASNWSSKSNLPDRYNAVEHASRHRKDFPEIETNEQYIKMAQEWLKSPPPGTLSKPRKRADGGQYYYHEPTNTFGAKNELGQPMTLFKPTDGRLYYDRQ